MSAKQNPPPDGFQPWRTRCVAGEGRFWGQDDNAPSHLVVT